MASTEKVNIFCDLLDQFLQELYTAHPDASLYTIIKLTQAMRYMYPREIVNQFMECILPYENQIINRDENFFLDGGLTKDYNHSALAMQEIDKVTSIWKDPQTSDQTRKCIWEYFNLLLITGKSIII